MARTRKTTQNPTPDVPLALVYARVSTEEQVNEGASLAAQTATLITEATRRGWRVELVTDEGLSGKNLARPGLQSALERLDSGQAQVLLATRLDRVSRSTVDFLGLLDRAKRCGWRMVVLDASGVDMSTASGTLMATLLSGFAEFERNVISERTKAGMAQRKAEGVHVGRPVVMDSAVIARIKRERAAGASFGAIARGLNAEGVPTAHGGARWYPMTVKLAADRVG